MAATLKQLQGTLLELAFIPLLESAGYEAITQPGNDPTLEQSKNGLEVIGRSGRHQIDGIANFFLKPPFSHPYRLLVEGKYQGRPVGLPVIRNAVGVLKDVSEYWVVAPPSAMTATRAWKRAIPKSRYHYQYAVVASTPFTGPAEAYAFAHDVYLLPMARSRHFQPVLQSINALAKAITLKELNLGSFRRIIAEKFISPDNRDDETDLRNTGISEPALVLQSFRTFYQACRKLKIIVLAMLDEQFPLVLAPDPDLLSKSLGELLETEADGQPKTVEFHRDQKTKGWLLNYRGQDLFSFDLAPRLLRLSLEHGGLAFADESTLHLDATLVNLGKQIGGFDNRIHTLKLSISRDMLRQLQFELDREPIVEEEEEDE